MLEHSPLLFYFLCPAFVSCQPYKSIFPSLILLFGALKLIFAALEHMFADVKLVFDGAEHKFKRSKISFYFRFHQINRPIFNKKHFTLRRVVPKSSSSKCLTFCECLLHYILRCSLDEGSNIADGYIYQAGAGFIGGPCNVGRDESILA